MNLYSFSTVTFSFGVVMTAILAIIKRRDIVSIRLLLFSIAVCGWGFPFSFWINQNYSADTTLHIVRIMYCFVVLIPTTWIHFVFAFIDQKEPFKGFFLLNYTISFLLVATVPGPYFFTGLHSILNFEYIPSVGLFHHIHVIHYLTLVPIGFLYLIRAYKKAVGVQKIQLKYLLWGTVVGFIGGSSIYIPYYKIAFPLYLVVLMPAYPILTCIAVIRYGLFDVQEIADAFQKEKLAAIGIMASSLNHEIRNPLFIAKGRIESFKDGVERGVYQSKDQEEQKSKEVMDVAYEQLARAMDIMQRFSDFAKPMSVKQKKEKVSLKETAEDVLKLVSNEFELKKIKLNQISINGECIQANYRQVEEIFFNLIINACHAMDNTDSKKELSISAKQTKDKVNIEISDTGPGISKENQRRIFEPFYSTKGKKGSGLGLYITKQLVERNGGKISVKSKVGEGTKFLLEFKV